MNNYIMILKSIIYVHVFKGCLPQSRVVFVTHVFVLIDMYLGKHISSHHHFISYLI